MVPCLDFKSDPNDKSEVEGIDDFQNEFDSSQNSFKLTVGISNSSSLLPLPYTSEHSMSSRASKASLSTSTVSIETGLSQSYKSSVSQTGEKIDFTSQQSLKKSVRDATKGASQLSLCSSDKEPHSVVSSENSVLSVPVQTKVEPSEKAEAKTNSKDSSSPAKGKQKKSDDSKQSKKFVLLTRILNQEKMHVNVLYLRAQQEKNLFADVNDLLTFINEGDRFTVVDCWVKCKVK